jgi:hypothetical protein
LNVGGTLRNIVDIHSSQLKLVLDVLRGKHINTLVHDNAAGNLLSQKVTTLVSACSVTVFRHIPNFNLKQSSLFVLLNVQVDGEMCVDISHLVSVTFCDTDNHVVDERSDCSESSDILARTVVEFNVDNLWAWF